MTKEEFGKIFEGEQLRLSHFFHVRLYRKCPRSDINHIRKNLMQDTAYEAWKKLLIPKYMNCDPLEIIWRKAKDVWAGYFRKLAKEPLLGAWLDSVIQQKRSGEKLLEGLEARDLLLRMKAQFDISDLNWEILLNHLKGYSDQEIAEMMKLTEDAVTQRILRTKRKIGGRPSGI